MNHNSLPRQMGIVSRRAVVWWMATSSLGVGLFMFPRASVLAAGMGSAYAFVAEVGAVALGLWLAVSFMRRYPDHTVVQVAIRTMGLPGRLFMAAMATIMLLIITISLRSLANVTREAILQLTPTWAIVAVVALVVWYVASLGISPLSRTLQLLVPLLLLLGIVSSVPTLTNLQPYFLIPHWTSLTRETTAFYRQFYVFAGLQNVYILNAFVGRARVGSSVALGLVISTVILLALALMTVGIFGIDALAEVAWPGPFVFKAVVVHGFYLQRIGFLAIYAMLGWVVLFLTVTSQLTAVGLVQTLGLPMRSLRWVLPTMILVAAAVGLMIPDTPTTEQIAFTWVAPLTIFMLLGEPLVLRAGAWWHRRRTAARHKQAGAS